MYTVITNISYTDYKGCRMWCHGITIDNEPYEGFGEDKIRQIRGFTWGGLSVFTIWVDPECDIEFIDMEGGRVVFISDDGKYNMDAGMIVKAGDIQIRLSPDDRKKPFKIEQVDSVPFGDDVDNRILPFAGGINYPKVLWTKISEYYQWGKETTKCPSHTKSSKQIVQAHGLKTRPIN